MGRALTATVNARATPILVKLKVANVGRSVELLMVVYPFSCTLWGKVWFECSARSAVVSPLVPQPAFFSVLRPPVRKILSALAFCAADILL
jgi:hypothetical protein